MFKEVRTLLHFHCCSKNIEYSTFCQSQSQSRSFKQGFKPPANWTDTETDAESVPIVDGGKAPVHDEDPDVQLREKVQKVPPASAAVRTHTQSLWRLRCPGAFLEAAGAPGPQRCLNQTPSKGQKAFAHHLPQGELPPPAPNPGERKTSQGWKGTDT